MKTNSKRPMLKIFIDPETKEYVGFSGTVAIYDKNIYIDTDDGKGYAEAIEILSPLVYKLAHKFHFVGNEATDTKHDIIVNILEGIPKYDPRRGTKLSTFIEMRVCRRLINRLRDDSRIYKNATSLNIKMYHITCECGNDFTLFIGSGGMEGEACKACGVSINKAKRKVSLYTPEISEAYLNLKQTGGGSDKSVLIEDYGAIFERSHIKPIDERVIQDFDIQVWLKNEDPKTVEMVKLIYFQDFSIKMAAEKVGMSNAKANIKLKKLQNNPLVKEIFNR